MSNDIDNELISRREFTVESVMALLAGVTITVSGCGGTSSSPSSPTPTGGSGEVSGAISANHGHRAVIAAAAITAGTDVTLDIRGDATHPHTVALSGAEVRSIGARTQVTKTSSDDNGHTHTVTFN